MLCCVCVLLHIINHFQALPYPSFVYRYNMGAKCAEHCMALGYSDKANQLGYQTFLYRSENELRRVLMFLVDKLPKGKIKY